MKIGGCKKKCDVKGKLRELIIKSSKALFLNNFWTNFKAQKGEIERKKNRLGISLSGLN